MSWILFLLAAGGAVFFLLRARQRARQRFDEILEREAQEQHRKNGPRHAPRGRTDKRT